jgi:uncharacterized protein (TIGR03067 family)
MTGKTADSAGAKNSMKWLLEVPVCMVLATMTMAAPALKDRKNDDKSRIVGNWAIEALSVRGEESKSSSGMVRFAADGSCGITHGPPGSNEFGAVYTLDPSTTPRRMKWLNGPDRTEWDCLYEFDGERLKVAFVDRDTQFPRTIEPTANLTIYYLKRVKE